mmetsp:Transcript_9002/g.26757  ORF Transcript_9002/g.26757 Transcript_9002/m.26757 type:complete len:380 (+) Transcript_9002:102-1241(+)
MSLASLIKYLPRENANVKMLTLLLNLLFLASCIGFSPVTTSTTRTSRNGSNSGLHRKILSSKKYVEGLEKKEINLDQDKSSDTKLCFWRPKGPKSWWIERIKIEDLKVGQELSGHVVQEFLEAKTGPKLYFECGIGRTDKNGDWRIVNGMLRLERGKASVARKRAARFRRKDHVQLFVSRVQKECGRLEVCAKVEDVQKYDKPKISVTSLKKNQEVTGEVVKLYPYGAIVDIGANVRGLIHITKVSRLLNQYVNKEEGLKNAGLEKGAKVRLMVESVKNRRLSLDFTDDVKEDVLLERGGKKQQTDEPDNSQNTQELEDWVAYANQQAQKESAVKESSNDSTVGGDEYSDDYGDDYDDDYDDKYDEEMDIESSLGLDMY